MDDRNDQQTMTEVILDKYLLGSGSAWGGMGQADIDIMWHKGSRKPNTHRVSNIYNYTKCGLM